MPLSKTLSWLLPNDRNLNLYLQLDSEVDGKKNFLKIKDKNKRLQYILQQNTVKATQGSFQFKFFKISK